MRLSLNDLVQLCRFLHVNLAIGKTPREVLEEQANRGSRSLRGFARAAADALRQGKTLSESIPPAWSGLPPIVRPLVKAGEDSGSLAEIFADLEKHFERDQKLQRRLRAQIATPLVILFLAIFVISATISVLGALGSNVDLLGIGIQGPTGAGLLLVGAVSGFVLLYLLIRTLRRNAGLESRLLRVPWIGPAMQSLALHRFCESMQVMLKTDLSMERCTETSLRATGNRAFFEGEARAVSELRQGRELRVALRRHGRFPDDFLTKLIVAEESGQIDGFFKRSAAHYQDESARRLSGLSKGIGYGVWVLVGLLLVSAIMRMAQTYFDVLNQQ